MFLKIGELLKEAYARGYIDALSDSSFRKEAGWGKLLSYLATFGAGMAAIPLAKFIYSQLADKSESPVVPIDLRPRWGRQYNLLYGPPMVRMLRGEEVGELPPILNYLKEEE